MLGLGLSLQKGVSAFNAGRAIVSSYIRRVTGAGGVLQNTACDVAAINELNQDRLLEPASWVLVPDGIKEDVVYTQKPSTGLGDLTFTRASDATYTDASGVVRRSPYNLLQQSEMFSNAIWTKNSYTIGIDATLAPNGTLTADKLIAGAGQDPNAANSSGIVQTSALPANVYTFSIYAKSAEFTSIRFREATWSGQFLTVDLTNGAITGGGSQFNSPSATSVGNGWYRISFRSNSTTLMTNASQYVVRCANTGDGTSGVFIWGAQLVEGTSALDYFPTTNRQDVPRIDFRNADGTLSSCGRLLLEPQRTNSIRNSSMVGAVAGSPGTLPTNWGITNGGLTRSVVGIGTENGLPYIDFRLNGTATGTTALTLFESSTGITAATGQTWTNSFYIKTISSTPNAFRSVIAEYTSIGTYVTENSIAITATSNLTRPTHTYTLAGGATVGRVLSGVVCNLTIGQTYDFTIRIAAPQMELGAYATTWVPTTTAAVTRLADSASKTGVSSLIGQTQGTLFVDINTQARASYTYSAIYTSSSSFIGIATSNTFVQMDVVVSGSVQASIRLNNSENRQFKMAAAYKANDFVFYVNGIQVGTDTSGSIPSMSSITLFDSSLGNANALYYNQAAIFPTRLSNDQLEVLTSEGYGNYALLAQSLNYVLQ